MQLKHTKVTVQVKLKNQEKVGEGRVRGLNPKSKCGKQYRCKFIYYVQCLPIQL